MKMVKMLICFLCALLVFSSMPITAFASYGKIYVENEPALYVTFKDGEKPLVGAEFNLYMVADIDEDGNYFEKTGFEGFNIAELAKDVRNWRDLAQTLEGHVLKNNIAPIETLKTDENGELSFPENVEGFICGLYLLVGHAHEQDELIYQAESALVQLPANDPESEDWNYDVTIKPKYTSKPKEEESYITRKVLKIWKDEGLEHARPKEIEVTLLCDGKVYETVVLNRKNGWKYTWENLEENHHWNVTEKVPKGYSAKITKEGITFVITNTAEKEVPPTTPSKPNIPEKPDDPKLPQTGQLWWPVPALAFLGILFVSAGIILKKGGAK